MGTQWVSKFCAIYDFRCGALQSFISNLGLLLERASNIDTDDGTWPNH